MFLPAARLAALNTLARFRNTLKEPGDVRIKETANKRRECQSQCSRSESPQLRFASISCGIRKGCDVAAGLRCRGTRKRGRSPVNGDVVLSVCVYTCYLCHQEMTMGRRPTIQTTVTASLTKSSLGGCNQMSPARFASTYACLSEG